MIDAKRIAILQKIYSKLNEKTPSNFDPSFNIRSYSESILEDLFLALGNDDDKLTLAQVAHNSDLCRTLAEKKELDLVEFLRYGQLKSVNSELYKTINFDILSDDYAFLKDELPLITIDPNVQMRILSLNKNRLDWFKQVFCRVKEISSYPPYYISRILENIGDSPFEDCSPFKSKCVKLCDILDKNNEPLTEMELDNIIYMLSSSGGAQYAKYVDEKSDISNIQYPQFKLALSLNDFISDQKLTKNKDINGIKQAFLLRFFGILFDDKENPRNDMALQILARFNSNGLEITDENNWLFMTYTNLKKVYSEKNPDLLIQIYESLDSQKVSPTLNAMTTFQNELRREFSKQTNEALFKTKKGKIKEYNGVKVVEPDGDFKLLVTAIGAFGVLKTPENFNDYWNSRLIRSHGNCCSLIANDSLAMARVRTVIFGFEDMPLDSLLAESNTDINTTPKSCHYDINGHVKYQHYFSPQTLIDRTRYYFNELVYERKNLDKNAQNFKKNPDYLVFIKEYEDGVLDRYKDNEKALEYIKKQLEDEEKRFKITLKASQDFGDLPIVLINRESCAKAQRKLVDEMAKEFEKTHNPDLIPKMLTKFQNNYTGLRDFAGSHILNKNTYFPRKRMRELQFMIEDYILNEPDKKKWSPVLDSYQSVISKEEKICSPSTVTFALDPKATQETINNVIAKKILSLSRNDADNLESISSKEEPSHEH